MTPEIISTIQSNPVELSQATSLDWCQGSKHRRSWFWVATSGKRKTSLKHLTTMHAFTRRRPMWFQYSSLVNSAKFSCLMVSPWSKVNNVGTSSRCSSQTARAPKSSEAGFISLVPHSLTFHDQDMHWASLWAVSGRLRTMEKVTGKLTQNLRARSAITQNVSNLLAISAQTAPGECCRMFGWVFVRPRNITSVTQLKWTPSGK